MVAAKNPVRAKFDEVNADERAAAAVERLRGLLGTAKGRGAADIFQEDWMGPLFESLSQELDALIAGQNAKGWWTGRWRQVLREVVAEEVRNLLSLERQLRGALPEMTRAATESSVRNVLGELRTMTREHEQRLEAAAQLLAVPREEKTSTAMEGFLTAIMEVIHENPTGFERDYSLVSAVLKVEDYKIVCYGCARTFAQILGADAVAGLLQANSEEELQTHAKLEYLAEFVKPSGAGMR